MKQLFKPVKLRALAFIQGIFTGIIERRQAAMKLQEAEIRYRTLFEQSPYGVIIADPETAAIVEFNDAFCTQLGYTRDEFAGMRIFDFEAVETSEETKRHIAEIKRRDGDEFLTKHRTKQGEIRDYIVLAKPIELLGKKLLLSIHRDITERMRIERMVKEERDKAHKYLDIAEVMLVAIGAEQRVTLINRKGCEILGYAENEIIGKNWFDNFLPERVRSEVKAVFSKMIAGEIGAAKYFVNTVVTSSGEERTIVWHNTILNDEKGKIVGTLSSGEDITERERWEEELKLRAQLLDSATDSIFLHDLDGNFIFVNEAAYKSLGYTREELMSTNLHQLDTQEYSDLFKSRMQELLAKGSLKFETVHFRKDGTTRPAEVHDRVIESKGRKLVLGVIRDITERKQAEEKLSRQNKVLSAIGKIFREALLCETEEELAKTCLTVCQEITGSQFGWIGELNKEGRLDTIALTNPGWGKCEMPASEAPLLIQNMEVRGIWGRVFKDEKTIIANDPASHPDRVGFPKGHPPVTSYIGAPIKEGDKTVGIVSLANKQSGYTLYDAEALEVLAVAIWEALSRKRAEEELKLRAQLLDNASDSIFVRDLDENFVYANETALRALGYSREEFLKLKIRQVIAPGYIWIREHLLQELQEKGEVTFETADLRKDGSMIPMEAHARLIESRGKKFILSTVRDITERRKMQDKLVVTDRLAALGEMTLGLSHELNNPLTVVIGYSQLLLDDKKLTKNARIDVERIHSQAQRAAAVIKNFLAFARKQAPVKQPTDINSVINTVLKLREYEDKIKNINVVTNLSPDLPAVMADVSQLQQVFLNIVINAEYFMLKAHNKGTLTVTTERAGDMVKASFANDGPVIPKENLTNIFNPFFTTKEVGQGTGLGLSICHGIISEHGGRIYAESEPGKGATFVVELPVVK